MHVPLAIDVIGAYPISAKSCELRFEFDVDLIQELRLGPAAHGRNKGYEAPPKETVPVQEQWNIMAGAYRLSGSQREVKAESKVGTGSHTAVDRVLR